MDFIVSLKTCWMVAFPNKNVITQQTVKKNMTSMNNTYGSSYVRVCVCPLPPQTIF